MTVELDSTPDKCYNCGIDIERGLLFKIKVIIESPLDDVLRFENEPKKGEPRYQNNKICPTCTLIIAGILNKDVLPPHKREKGVIIEK